MRPDVLTESQTLVNPLTPITEKYWLFYNDFGRYFTGPYETSLTAISFLSFVITYFITIECLEDGEIRLFGLHDNSDIKSLNDPIGQCNANNVKKESNLEYYRIPKACTTSTPVQVRLNFKLSSYLCNWSQVKAYCMTLHKTMILYKIHVCWLI